MKANGLSQWPDLKTAECQEIHDRVLLPEKCFIKLATPDFLSRLQHATLLPTAIVAKLADPRFRLD
jgi:hypothetical protein